MLTWALHYCVTICVCIYSLWSYRVFRVGSWTKVRWSLYSLFNAESRGGTMNGEHQPLHATAEYYWGVTGYKEGEMEKDIIIM